MTPGAETSRVWERMMSVRLRGYVGAGVMKTRSRWSSCDWMMDASSWNVSVVMVKKKIGL